MSEDDLLGFTLRYDERYKKDVLMESELEDEEILEMRLEEAKNNLEELRERKKAASEASSLDPLMKEELQLKKEMKERVNKFNKAAIVRRRETSSTNRITIGMRRAIIRLMFGSL